MIHTMSLIGKLVMLQGIVLCLYVTLAEYLYYGYIIYNGYAQDFQVRNYFDYLPVARVLYYWVTSADPCSLSVC